MSMLRSGTLSTKPLFPVAQHRLPAGLQVLAGDVKLAADTFNNFIAVWQKYGVIPERYHYLTAQMHPTERHYPLRPELMESALYLMQAR